MPPLRVLVVLEEGDTSLASLASALRGAGQEVRVAAPAVAAELLGPGGPGFDAVLRAPLAADAPTPLDDAERHHIAATLRHTRGNKRQAAHLLGIARSTLLAKVRKYGLSVLLALALLPSGRLLAQHPLPASEQLSGHLGYDGHGTFGGFVGSTDSVLGRLNAAADLARVTGYVAARAQTLRTGNGKRDRDQWASLQVETFPFIRYDVDSLTVGATHGDTLAVVLHGRFDIHGVRRTADLPARLLLTSTAAHLLAATPLDLRDYRIGGLSKFFGALKMDPAIVVHIDVLFTLSAPAPAAR